MTCHILTNKMSHDMCGCIKIPRLTPHDPYLWVGGEGGEKTPKLRHFITKLLNNH